MGLGKVKDDWVVVLTHERNCSNESILIWVRELRCGKNESLEKRGIVRRDKMLGGWN